MTSICKLEQLLKIYTDLEALSICHLKIDGVKNQANQVIRLPQKLLKSRKLQWRNRDNNQASLLLRHNPNFPRSALTGFFCTFSFPACLLAIRRAASHSHLDVISSIWRHLEQPERRREKSQAKEMSLPKTLFFPAQRRPQMMSNKALIFLPYSYFPVLKSSLKLLFGFSFTLLSTTSVLG